MASLGRVGFLALAPNRARGRVFGPGMILHAWSDIYGIFVSVRALVIPAEASAERLRSAWRGRPALLEGQSADIGGRITLFPPTIMQTPRIRGSGMSGSATFFAWRCNGLTTFVSGASGDRDVLSPSLPNLAPPFPTGRKFRKISIDNIPCLGASLKGGGEAVMSGAARRGEIPCTPRSL